MSITVELLVTVVCAKNLIAKDDNGFSDPYVILKVGGKQYRTKVIPRTLFPEFHETFVMKAREYEPVRVEVWDKDQFSSDDYEGGFTLNWWMLDDLVEKGAVTGMSFPLRRGHGLRKNVPVGGALTLDIKVSNYAKALAEQGKLKEVFPDTPASETIIRADDCCLARVPEGVTLKLPTSSHKRLSRKRSGSNAPEHKTDIGIETYPGTVFLLDHFIYAYGVSLGEPLKVELGYEDIKSAVPYGADVVLITTTKGWHSC